MSIADTNAHESREPRWSPERLDRIVEADDLHVAPYRPDGITPGTPTRVWCVQVDGELYARAYNGTASRWYRAALEQQAGQITAVGARIDVAFEPASAEIDADLDAAYRAKYPNSPYLGAMIGVRARAATVRVRPRTAADERG